MKKRFGVNKFTVDESIAATCPSNKGECIFSVMLHWINVPRTTRLNGDT